LLAKGLLLFFLGVQGIVETKVLSLGGHNKVQLR